jgi:fibronectin-binding autotransporter adhesin
MSARRSTVRKLVLAVASASIASVASATTYTDVSSNTGTPTDVAGTPGPSVDFSNVVITNDAFDLHVTINLNSAANTVTFPYARYLMGIQVGNGAGGQTAINNSGGSGATFGLGDPAAGNPYGTPVGISTGENFFIGSQVSTTATGGTDTTGGATLYGYSPAAGVGWSTVYNTYLDVPATTRFSSTATSLSFFFPLTSFGFTTGSTFKFDLWSTFPGGDGAYDAFDNPNVPPQPFSPVVPYDSATQAGSLFSSAIYTVVGSTVDATWATNGGGSWNAAGNWTPSVPNGPGSTATFGSILTVGNAPAAVTVDSSQTVGRITFNNTNTYNLTSTGGSSLTINDTGDSDSTVNPLITALAGNHTIAVPIFLSAGVTLNAAASSSLSISGDVSTDGISGVGPMTITGAGSVTLSGTNTYSGNTTVSSGATLNVGSASLAGALPATTTLISNGKTTFAANPGTGVLARTVAGVTLSTGGQVVVANPISGIHGNRSVLATGALTFGGSTNGWQGVVDLGSNDMIVQGGGATSLANITNQLKLGFHSGHWNGTGGIVSSAAAGNTRFLTALGSRLSDGTPFDSVNTTTNDVLVKYTYYGDADLNGVINGADYALLDTGFGLHQTGWQHGDFNYDGVVNGTDYALIDNTFNQITATSATPLAIVAAASVSSAVPEPTTLGLIGIGAMGLLGRRRRCLPKEE